MTEPTDLPAYRYRYRSPGATGGSRAMRVLLALVLLLLGTVSIVGMFVTAPIATGLLLSCRKR